MNKIIILGILVFPFSLLFTNVSNEKLATDQSHSLKDGEAVYKKYCITCHQVDGGGVPHMAPPLIKSKYVSGDKSSTCKNSVERAEKCRDK